MIGAHDTKLMLMNCGIRPAVISNPRRSRTGHDLVRGAEDAATMGTQSPLQSDYVWRGLADLVEHRVMERHLTGEKGGRYPHHLMLSGYTTHFLFSYRERHLTVPLATNLLVLGQC